MRHIIFISLYSIAILSLSTGCNSGPSPLSPDSAGEIIEEATATMLVRLARDLEGGVAERPELAFAGIDNNSGWEVGSMAADAEEHIETEFLNTGLIRLVDNRLVKEVMSISGVDNPAQLYVPAQRESFLSHLSEKNVRPRYLVWGAFTSIDDLGGGRQASRHRFSLELANGESGEILYKSTKVIKGR